MIDWINILVIGISVIVVGCLVGYAVVAVKRRSTSGLLVGLGAAMMVILGFLKKDAPKNKHEISQVDRSKKLPKKY
ncbi:hypothetical protein K2W90_07045 [Candidatus Babeliales bacterium]|nr:hypothetical protein [Candidatus Babeliales bacterium]